MIVRALYLYSIRMELTMGEPHFSLLSDVVALFAVFGVGWILLLFLSRGWAWMSSAALSALLFVLLAAGSLAQAPGLIAAGPVDVANSMVLCLVIHLVSDLGLIGIGRGMVRVPMVYPSTAALDPIPTENPALLPNLRTEPIRSTGD